VLTVGAKRLAGSAWPVLLAKGDRAASGDDAGLSEISCAGGRLNITPAWL
jgi:hypothetical protein